jgi:hypothetical protein
MKTMEIKKHYQLFINGQYVDSSSGEVFETLNPATEEVIATVVKLLVLLLNPENGQE